MKTRLVAVLAGVIGLSVAVPAQAAQSFQLTGVKGPVLVSRGDGFRPVAGSTAVRPGDRVIVNSQGQATLDYGAGCRVQLKEGIPVTVASASPCAGATGQVAAGSQGLGSKLADTVVYAAVGVGVVATGIWVWDELLRDEDEEPPPVSP